MNLNTYRELNKAKEHCQDAREILPLIEDENTRNALQSLVWSVDSLTAAIKAAV